MVHGRKYFHNTYLKKRSYQRHTRNPQKTLKANSIHWFVTWLVIRSHVHLYSFPDNTEIPTPQHFITSPVMKSQPPSGLVNQARLCCSFFALPVSAHTAEMCNCWWARGCFALLTPERLRFTACSWSRLIAHQRSRVFSPSQGVYRWGLRDQYWLSWESEFSVPEMSLDK